MSAQAPQSPQVPSGKRLAFSVLVAALVAAIVLAIGILPAEYGVDPTGIGRAAGFTRLSEPARTLQISDVVGGNETVRDVEIPDFGEPVPLPNPAVHQRQTTPPRTKTFHVTIPSEQETEIKAVLAEGKMILYSWQVDRGMIYSDFHGHDPAAGDEFWVRYQEDQEGAGGDGSLVAPFAGEHGWYWLNYNDFPVDVTLTITGYFEDTKDYGIF